MATIYKIKIKIVSAFCSYDEKYIKQIFDKFLKEYISKDSNLGFESTEIEVERNPQEEQYYNETYKEDKQ